MIPNHVSRIILDNLSMIVITNLTTQIGLSIVPNIHKLTSTEKAHLNLMRMVNGQASSLSCPTDHPRTIGTKGTITTEKTITSIRITLTVADFIRAIEKTVMAEITVCLQVQGPGATERLEEVAITNTHDTTTTRRDMRESVSMLRENPAIHTNPEKSTGKHRY